MPDLVEEHVPGSCQACGKSLAQIASQGYHKRQLTDLPAPSSLLFHEYRVMVKQYSCGHKNAREFPPEANAPVQYGHRIKSHVSYLHHWQLIPIGRTAELL
ncbi:MAG: IS66 family transposase, partial [Bacteroidota bacterium]